LEFLNSGLFTEAIQAFFSPRYPEYARIKLSGYAQRFRLIETV
jgi:hypothetical protein